MKYGPVTIKAYFSTKTHFNPKSTKYKVEFFKEEKQDHFLWVYHCISFGNPVIGQQYQKTQFSFFTALKHHIFFATPQSCPFLCTFVILAPDMLKSKINNGKKLVFYLAIRNCDCDASTIIFLGCWDININDKEHFSLLVLCFELVRASIMFVKPTYLANGFSIILPLLKIFFMRFYTGLFE